jgi:putative flippase GtrA
MTSFQRLASFAAVGALSTIAYLALYSVLRLAMTPAPANAVALVVTAVANTAANRRLTFGVRGSEGLARDHVVGLSAFAIALAITSAAVAVLGRIDPGAGRTVELAVLAAANVVATGCRFLLLRRWIGAGRSSVPGLVAVDDGMPFPELAVRIEGPR